MITKTKIEIDDFLMLIHWVFNFSALEQKKFDHMQLMEQAETYKLSSTPLDIKIHKVDDFMVDVYRVYERLSQMEEKIETAYDHIFPMIGEVMSKILPGSEHFSFPSKEALLKEIDRFGDVFSDMMENYQYEDTEIRGIQRNFLKDKLKDCTEKEEYERAAQIRDRLKTF